MKIVVGAFNKEKALVGAFSVIVKPMDRLTAITETPSRGSQESGANTDQTLDVPRKIMKKISTKSCKYEAGHVGGLVFNGGL